MQALLAALLLAQPAAPEPAPPDYAEYVRFVEFDHHFSKYGKRQFGAAFDWRYFKAQAVAESGLRPGARSPAGAAGIMQIMPATYAEIRRRNPAVKGPVDDPRWNIAAGIWYDRQHYRAWTAERSFDDRLRFMFGSYNAGRGSILRAQQAAEAAGLDGAAWESVARELPRITGRHAAETLAYVGRIFTIKEDLSMELSILALNFAYALLGAACTVGSMALGFRLFDRLTPFDTRSELAKGNVAVGIVVGSIFVGVGLAVGLVIGLGLN